MVNLAVSIRIDIKQNSQSVPNNTSAVTVNVVANWTNGSHNHTGKCTGTLTIDGTSYSFTGLNFNTQETTTGSEVIMTKTVTVGHNDDGTRTLICSASFATGISSGTVTASASKVLTTIPRASGLTAGNGTLGTEQTLTIEAAAATFKHRLFYRCGKVTDYIAGSATTYTSDTSIKWTPRIGLAAENTTGTTVLVELILHTYTSDGTHVGTTSQAITCAIPASVKPSCSVAWEDLSGAAGTYGAPVQGISRLKITMTEQTSQSSPIASRSISANGAKFIESPATTGVLTAAGANQIVATVKDRRGRIGTSSVTLDVLAYAAPVVSKLSVYRCNAGGVEDDQGDYVKATFSAAISDLNGRNPASYKLRYKDSAAAVYTEIPLSALAGVYVVNSYEYVFAADGSSSYDVEIVATDNHGAATRATSASTAFTLMNWNAAGNGMAFGKVSEKANAVEFALDLYDKNGAAILGVGALVDLLMPVGFITLRYDHINPGTLYGGTWVRVSNYILRGVAEGGQIGETGTLADGSGRTYINIAIWRRTA